MNDAFVLNPILPISLLITTIVLLSGAFLFFELRRPRRFLILRVIALSIMMLSLAAIAFRPSIKSVRSQAIGLLTANYDSKKLDSIQKRTHTQWITLPNVDAYAHSKRLSSINDLEKLSGKIAFVAGDGLPTSAQTIISGNFAYLPSSYPQGIIGLNLPDQVYAHRSNVIEGSINSSSPVKITLENGGRSRDSVQLNGKGVQNFSLKFNPREAGNFLFTVTVQKEGNSPTTHTLPVSVQPKRTYRVLCIQNFPTFETQYLKKFLGKENEVQIRYQLSKNTFRHEAINTAAKKVNRLTDEVLRDFDLLIIDSDALESLATSEIADLRNSINQGLGTIILFNQSPENLRITKSFLPSKFKKYSADTAKVKLQKDITLQAWPLIAEPNALTQPILRNKNRMLSGYSNSGFGKVAFQLLQETYHLVLDGDSTSYAEIWSDLIENVSRTEPADFTITIKNKFPVYQDEPIALEMISSGKTPSLEYDGVPISIEEDLYIDNIWRTVIWANEPGWHSVSSDSTREYFYVSKKGDWQALTAANSIRSTSVKSSPDKNRRGHQEVLERINPLWFYISFLVSAALLWVLPKL
jgi:hypothetical protein